MQVYVESHWASEWVNERLRRRERASTLTHMAPRSSGGEFYSLCLCVCVRTCLNCFKCVYVYKNSTPTLADDCLSELCVCVCSLFGILCVSLASLTIYSVVVLYTERRSLCIESRYSPNSFIVFSRSSSLGEGSSNELLLLLLWVGYRCRCRSCCCVSSLLLEPLKCNNCFCWCCCCSTAAFSCVFFLWMNVHESSVCACVCRTHSLSSDR